MRMHVAVLAMPQLAFNLLSKCLDMFIQCNACKNTFALLSIFKDGSTVIFEIHNVNVNVFISFLFTGYLGIIHDRSLIMN